MPQDMADEYGDLESKMIRQLQRPLDKLKVENDLEAGNTVSGGLVRSGLQ